MTIVYTISIVYNYIIGLQQHNADTLVFMDPSGGLHKFNIPTTLVVYLYEVFGNLR